MRKHILYLASGNSRRFGENKLLYPFRGKLLYQHGLDTLQTVLKKRTDCTLTVVSQYAEIRADAASRGIPVVDSPESVLGISHTIRAGISKIQGFDISAEDFVIFVVADQPNLTISSLERLLDCVKEDTETASLACGARVGNPALFSCRLLPELLALEGDTGGRAVIRKHHCIYVQADAEQELRDIDTKEDCNEKKG